MNLIWIVSDTYRKDHLGCYGNSWMHTPALNALASKSVRFNRHYAADFPTMPARADFFTGRWTGSFMRWEAIPRGQRTIARWLTLAGFHTAAVVDNPFYLRNNMNYDLGFRSFIEVEGQEYWSRGVGDDTRAAWRAEQDRFAPQSFTRAMNWLERHYKENFFLYIDIWDPHEPWDAPNYYTELYMPDYDGEIVEPLYAHRKDVPGYTEEMVKKAHACYCGECTMVDTWTGYFLRKLENMRLMEKTAIVFTTDHGFCFGEHDGYFGKLCRAEPSATPYWFDTGDIMMRSWTRSPLWEEIAAIPLFIYVPGIKPGEYNGLTSAVDLMPTVMDILGQQIPETVEGKSLLPAVKDPKVKGRDFTITTHPFANAHQIIHSVDGQERETEGADTTVTTADWSLLYYPVKGQSWLYHLPSDPGQEKNVINQRPEVARELHQHLVKFMYDTHLPAELREPRMKLEL